MLSVLLVVGLFAGVLCSPLPNPLTQILTNEQGTAVEPSSSTITSTLLEDNRESGTESVGEEEMQAEEAFYPVGGVWWGIRPWGGWGGWGGYRPWHRPPWGGHWGGHWGGGHWGGGHWGGGPWGRTSS